MYLCPQTASVGLLTKLQDVASRNYDNKRSLCYAVQQDTVHQKIMSYVGHMFVRIAPIAKREILASPNVRYVSPVSQLAGYYDKKIGDKSTPAFLYKLGSTNSSQKINALPSLFHQLSIKMVGRLGKKTWINDHLGKKLGHDYMDSLNNYFASHKKLSPRRLHTHHFSSGALNHVSRVALPMPSVAPIRFKDMSFDHSDNNSQKSKFRNDHDYETPKTLQVNRAAHSRRRGEIEQIVTEMFDRQTRLPPSGATMFDPRLTPAWSGLKIPN